MWVHFSDKKTETQKKFRELLEVIVSVSYCHPTKHLKNSVTYNNKHVLVITTSPQFILGGSLDSAGLPRASVI